MYWKIHSPRPKRFPKGGDFNSKNRATVLITKTELGTILTTESTHHSHDEEKQNPDRGKQGKENAFKEQALKIAWWIDFAALWTYLLVFASYFLVTIVDVISSN